MKMLRAVIRPEKEEAVVSALESAGFAALTKSEVFGRGKQMGLQVGDTRYDELPKVLLMLVVDDEDASKAAKIIAETARTGSYGDGKIFLSDVEEAYTIRTGKKGL